MKPINLEDFETHIAIRNLTIEDYDALVELQALCFPGMEIWGRDQIESQLAIFPEGQFCVEYDGDLVASASSLIVHFDRYSEWHVWKEIADGGYIRNHTPGGDTLYGIEMMVHPEGDTSDPSHPRVSNRRPACGASERHLHARQRSGRQLENAPAGLGRRGRPHLPGECCDFRRSADQHRLRHVVLDRG